MFAPISINIENKKILIVGGGKVALLKSKGIGRFTSEITILAPNIIKELEIPSFIRLYKEYDISDIQGYFLVYACTNSREVNDQIRIDCEKAEILVSVCDNPKGSSFVSPAVYCINDLTISVGTNGRIPKHAIMIRNQIQVLAETGDLDLKYKEELK